MPDIWQTRFSILFFLRFVPIVERSAHYYALTAAPLWSGCKNRSALAVAVASNGRCPFAWIAIAIPYRYSKYERPFYLPDLYQGSFTR
jgi:hypothetical protein